MSEPVFVIHGVGNRDQDEFTSTVAALEKASGLELVPVYWGDLGADDRYADLAVPEWPPRPVVRGAVAPGDPGPGPGPGDDGLREAVLASLLADVGRSAAPVPSARPGARRER